MNNRPAGFDYGLIRPLLRVNLERGVKRRAETSKRAICSLGGAYSQINKICE